MHKELLDYIHGINEFIYYLKHNKNEASKIILVFSYELRKCMQKVLI